jgi:tape measure domain-containing protein
MASNINLVINGKNLAGKAIKEVTSDLKSAHSASDGLGSSMSSMLKIGFGTAMVAVGAGISATFASIKKAASFEDVSIQFDTLIGDASLAKTVLADLQDFAAHTPLSFESISSGASQLMAFGTEAEDIRGELQIIGDAAMGDSAKFGTLISAYGKLQAKGKASLEEINRFTENGVPILAQLAENYGVTTAEINKMISAGKIGFPEVKTALEDLTTGTGKFANMMEKKAISVNGRWSTFKDTIALTAIKAGTAFTPLTGSILETATKKLEEFSNSQAFQNLIEKTVRWASWAMGIVPKIGAVFSFVGSVIDISARHAGEALDKIGDIVIGSPVVNVLFNLMGDTYDALKKGFSTGDWGDAFGVSADILSAGFTIWAGLQLLDEAGSLLMISLKKAMASSGFSGSLGGMGAAGVVGSVSIAVGLIEAQESGDWEAFGANMLLGLAAGLTIGAFTKSPYAGALAFDLVMNLKMGDNWIENLKKEWDPLFSKMGEWFSEVPLETHTNNLFTKWSNSVVTTINTLFGNQKKYIEGDSFDLGENYLKGFDKGLESKWGGSKNLISSFFQDVILASKETLDEHSPSKESEEMGEFFIQGFLNGVNDPTWREEIIAAWKTLMDALRQDNNIDVEGTIKSITGGNTPAPQDVKKKFSIGNIGDFTSDFMTSAKSAVKSAPLGGLLDGSDSLMSSFGSGLSGMLTSLSSIKAILDPVSVVLSGIFDVLSPLIDTVLSPILGALTIVGRTIGNIIAPLFELLGGVTGILGEAFIWLYNKIILPVGNGFITVFNMLYNGVAGVINGIGKALRWLGVNMSMDYRSLDAGYLAEIGASDLTSAASSYTGSSSSTGGSSTSVQSVNIEYYQTIQGNVIGDGGLAALGQYFVKAVEAYMGNGGTVSFVQGS